MEEMDVFDESMIEFLQSGCALLVGIVDATGRPHAGRCWGLTVLDPHANRVRCGRFRFQVPTSMSLETHD